MKVGKTLGWSFTKITVLYNLDFTSVTNNIDIVCGLVEGRGKLD